MSIVVQKYGGSSVANPDKLREVARRVVRTKAAGYDVAVVVSAMGKTTDELLRLAHQVSPSPERRELDMLLSTGERISMALLSMAIRQLGGEAISFTGSQAGIITNDRHVDARIVEVRPYRIQDELARGKIVIVAGYQGVSYRREITTLGRGGSDTTAMALAAALDAAWCEICSDVDGVYTADPRVVPEARRIDELGYEETQELAESGAKVLNAQAVEFAKQKGIAIYARATASPPMTGPSNGDGTVIRKDAPPPPGSVCGITSEGHVLLLDATSTAPEELLAFLDEQEVPWKQLRWTGSDAGRLDLVIPLENLHHQQLFEEELARRFGERVCLVPGLGTVNAIGSGINHTSHNLRKGTAVLRQSGVAPVRINTSSLRISWVIPSGQVPAAVQQLHRHYLDPPTAPVAAL